MFCSQASIGTVVPGSPADEANLQRDDIIIHVNDRNVIGSSHHHVISLIHEAADSGWVTLGIQRAGPRSGRKYEHQGQYVATVIPRLKPKVFLELILEKCQRSSLVGLACF